MKTLDRANRPTTERFTNNTLIILMLLFGISINNAFAKTTIWTNGAGTNLWNNASNWSAGLPIAGDNVTFNSTYTANCNINQQVSLANFTISAGYTGTITLQTGDSLVLTTNFSQASGTFTGTNSTINVGGTFTLSGGTFTSTTGNLYVQSNFTISGSGNLVHNNGTLAFTQAGTTTITFPAGAVNFNNVIFNSSLGNTITANDTMVINGNLSLLQNQVKGGVIRLASTATITTNAAYAGGTTVIDIQAPLSITPLCANFNGIILNNASATFNAPAFGFAMNAPVYIKTGTFNGGSNNITFNGAFSQTGGTFNASTNTTNFDANFTYSSGTFNHNNGTVGFTTNAATFTNGGKNSFYNVQLNKTSNITALTLAATDTLKVNGALSLMVGTSNGGYYQLVGSGSIGGITSNTYIAGTTVLLITGSGTYTIPSNVNVPGITLNGASAIVSLTGTVSPTFAGALTLKSGTFNCNSNKLVLTQNLTISGATFNATTDTMKYNAAALTFSSGTFNHNNGTVIFNRGSSSTAITNAVKLQLYNMVINLTNAVSTNAAISVAANDTIVAVNRLELVAGNISSGTIEAKGTLTDDGSFGGGAGIIIIDNGSSARSINLASALQPGYTINDAQVTMAAPPTQAVTFNGAFNLKAGLFSPDVYAITFASTYTQSGGTFDVGVAAETITGSLSITNGTFNATSDTLELDGTANTFNVAATFNHNNGTLKMANTNANQTLTVPLSFNVYNFKVNLTGGTNYILTISAGDTVIVANKMSFTSGKVNTGIIKVVGTIDNFAGFSGGSATVIIAGGSGTRNITLPATTLSNLTLNDVNVTLTAPSSGTLTVGTLTLQKGTFTGTAAIVNVTGNYTQTGGTFSGSTGNLNVTGNFAVSGAGTVFTAPSDSLSVTGTITFTSPATINHNNGTLLCLGAVNKTFTTNATYSLYNLDVSMTGNAELRPTAALTILNNLNIGSGAIINQSTSGIDITLKGNFTDQNAAGAGITYGTRTFTFNGTSAGQTITGAGGTENFYKLTLSNPLGITLSNSNVYVYNTLTLTGSTGVKVYLGSNNITINAAATISGGTSNEYIVTGDAGYLMQENIGATGRSGTIAFPVGFSSTHYTPVSLKNTGTNDLFAVNVKQYAYQNGYYYQQVTTGALNQTYYVEEQTPGGSNVTLTLQWNASEELTGFDRTNCGIRHYTNGAWNREGTDGLALGSGPYSMTASGITSFSPFDGGSGGSTLPIELATFTADVNSATNNVDLKWTTEIEVNNDFFTLEHSTDAVNYTELTKVEGAGNSTIERNYAYTDNKPVKGVNYYRLKQTDYNGDNKYVGTQAVTIKSNNSIQATLSPNPLDGRDVKISLEGSNLDAGSVVSINITDMTGRNVYTNIMTAGSDVSFDLPPNLVQGIYLVRLSSGDVVSQQKLLLR